MNEINQDLLEDFVRHLRDCTPPKSLIQRQNVIAKIKKAKEVTDDIKEVVNQAEEENISKITIL